LIEAATIAISLDEPAFDLRELNFQAPDGSGWRRYQTIRVVRADRLATFKVDLGPKGSFNVQEFNIPAWHEDPVTGRVEIFHTVGQLREIADTMRLGVVFMNMDIEVGDIWNDWKNEKEHLWSMIQHGKRTYSLQGSPAIPLTERSG
jgi:hypothetical protein